jgi:hypothetical protein
LIARGAFGSAVRCIALSPLSTSRRPFAALAGIPLLEQETEAWELAEALVRDVPLPDKAAADALHIATAAVHGMQYLLTWSCTHFANVALRLQIEAVC